MVYSKSVDRLSHVFILKTSNDEQWHFWAVCSTVVTFMTYRWKTAFVYYNFLSKGALGCFILQLTACMSCSNYTLYISWPKNNVFVIVWLGSGVFATTYFNATDFLLEYRGILLSHEEAESHVRDYIRDDSVGSYMYFFETDNQTNMWYVFFRIFDCPY